MEDSTRASVQYIKTICFSSLPVEEKIKIKSGGRPKPNILITNTTKCKSREYKRTFKTEIYEKCDWICGCDVSNSLYCFPCLLFADDGQTEWTTSGVTDLIHLAGRIIKHQHSKTHLSAKLGFNLLGKQGIRQPLNRLNVEKHNEQVKRRRYVLSKIIDCIKFCGVFELALLDHDEEEDSLNPGIFKGLLNFSAELDLALGEHLHQQTMFKCTSKDFQNDLLDCILSVSQAHIKKEIADSKYVSVMIDESTDISNIFQMAIVLRYTLKNGTPVERFWSFKKPSDQNAVTGCIEKVLNYVLMTSNQLISQSYDGSNVMSGVQKLIKGKFPYAYYIQCYAHQLNLIISQATSTNTNVRIFFSDLSDITNFFSNSPQRVALLDEVIGNRIFEVSTTRWNLKNRTVNTVYEIRENLIEYMEIIQTTSRHSDTIVKAGALLRMLNDPKFVFWLTVFYRLMPHVDTLYSQLQKKNIDSVTIERCVSEFQKNIQREKDNIHTIKDSELHDVEVSQPSKRRKLDEGNVSRIVQAKEVCDTILSEMKKRFSFTDHLEIANLFSVGQFKEYPLLFPNQNLEAAVRTFPFLDKNKLKTELEIIYNSADFSEVSGAVHLLKFLIENNLEADFSETCSVLYAIVTMPMSTTEAERCFCTLNRIKTFLSRTAGQEKLSALAMLSVEKEMIRNIPNFNELVIEELFSKKKDSLDFQYKTCL